MQHLSLPHCCLPPAPCSFMSLPREICRPSNLHLPFIPAVAPARLASLSLCLAPWLNIPTTHPPFPTPSPCPCHGQLGRRGRLIILWSAFWSLPSLPGGSSWLQMKWIWFGLWLWAKHLLRPEEVIEEEVRVRWNRRARRPANRIARPPVLLVCGQMVTPNWKKSRS